MDTIKPISSAEYRTVKTIVLSPITWLPITGAFAIACLLPIPVWAGAGIVTLSMAAVIGFWKGSAERLYHVFKARESFEKQADAAQVERDSLIQLAASGFNKAADNLAACIEVAKKIQGTIIENPWLETYEYAQTTRTLIEELHMKARSLVAGASTKKETFEDERKALEETADTIRQLLQEQRSDNLNQSATEKLLRANELSRRARENARKAINEQTQ